MPRDVLLNADLRASERAQVKYPRRHVMRHIALLSLMLTVFCVESFGQNLARIDLRNRSESDEYAIAFSADAPDGNSVGHAFVTLYHSNEDQRATLHRGIGFYPRTSINAVQGVLGVPGQVVDDTFHNYDTSLVVNVNRETFDRVATIIDRWSSSTPGYRLTYRDCVSFASEVADAIGLDTPSRWGSGVFYPEDFVEALIEGNDHLVREADTDDEAVVKSSKQDPDPMVDCVCRANGGTGRVLYPLGRRRLSQCVGRPC